MTTLFLLQEHIRSVVEETRIISKLAAVKELPATLDPGW